MSFEAYISSEKKDLIITEDEFFMAIIEPSPIAMGHCVVFPKRRVDAFFDLTDQELSKILIFSKPICNSIKSIFPCEKIGIAAIGLQTRHAHLHLVPINSADDLNFTKIRLTLTNDELMALANKIKNKLK